VTRTLAAAAVGLAIGFAGCKKLAEVGEKIGERREPIAEADVEPEPPPAPPPVPTGPGLAPGKYTLTELRVEVAASNGKRERWDDKLGPDPDLVVDLRVDGTTKAICRSPESTVARCRPNIEIAIDGGSAFDLTVVDEDPIDDDEIGSAALRDPSRWGTAIDLPMAPTGRVRAASVRFAPIPTWWELNRVPMLGLGIGIAAALLVVGLFRRTLLAPDPEPPPPPPPPRCTHCDALIVAGELTCRKCGAAL
jgi:hypothetical protein